MLNALDAVLHQLFASRLTLLRAGTPPTVLDDQIGFRPPDADWRTDVDGLSPRRALNVYLVELRENRKLRSNERVRTIVNGEVTDEPAPVRVDCRYVITAWSPADESAGRTQDEHELLGEVLAVLTTAEPLVPRRVFAPGPLPATFPPYLAEAELPLAVAPTDGFPQLPEFWNTMAGPLHPWKPAVVAVVTVPVRQVARMSGPPVTTAAAAVGTNGSADTLVAIGGRLVDGTGAEPRAVAGAHVRIETLAGDGVATSESDDLGRFRLGCFTPGDYRLRAAVAGFAPAARDVTVPSASGEYDLELS
jgi:hypothetical protein